VPFGKMPGSLSGIAREPRVEPTDLVVTLCNGPWAVMAGDVE
jgi:hypothetical protein